MSFSLSPFLFSRDVSTPPDHATRPTLECDDAMDSQVGKVGLKVSCLWKPFDCRASNIWVILLDE